MEFSKQRILEWGTISYSRGSSRPRDQTHVSCVSCISRQILFFFNINWRLITLQYCSGFCHTLTWISYECTCVPHPEPPSHLPLHTIPLGHLSAPAQASCILHQTWTGDSFLIWYYTYFSAILPNHPPATTQSPKDSSIHQCLFCCLVHRVIVTIFLNSIYMR